MKRSAILATVIFAILVLYGLIAAPYTGDAYAIDVAHWQGNPLPPCFQNAVHCAGHVLGTDENGRDVLARLAVGMRYSLGIALLALAIAYAIAASLAALATRGGRFADFVLCGIGQGIGSLSRLPFLLLFAMVFYLQKERNPERMLVGPSAFLIAVWLGVLLWPRAMLLLREGAGHIEIARRALSDFITLVLLGATLDFFGFGVFPPNPSWGNMLANAESDMEVAWWAVIFPGLCIFATALLLEIVRRGLPPAIAHYDRRRP